MNPPRLRPFRRPAAFDTLASAKEPHYEFFDVSDASRWFDQLLLAGLPPGATETSAFPADGSETFYIFSDGSGELTLPDGSRKTVRQFDGLFFGSGAGCQLKAGPKGLQWLAMSTNGGKPTPYAGRSMQAVLSGAGDRRPEMPIYFDRRWIAPRQWPANTLGATAKPWWFYTVTQTSKWYHSACVSSIPPGGSSTFHSHMERYEGPYETFYVALKGTAMIRNEYEDFLFEGGPSGVFVPADASHQIINSGEEPLWYITHSSRGGAPLKLDVYNTPSGIERPGYLDEFNRVMAVRQANGLPLP